jgi:3-dehydro-L-gulonate 2-dehydrogenase
MVGELPVETELSQVFIAIDLDSFPDRDVLMKNIDDTLQDMKTSTPVTDGKAVYFPGENMMRTRRENMEKGIPVDEGIWQKVLDM